MCPGPGEASRRRVIDRATARPGRPDAITGVCADPGRAPGNQIVGLLSVGPDGAADTNDDIASWQLGNELASVVRGSRWTSKQPASATRASSLRHSNRHAGSNAGVSATSQTATAAPTPPPKVEDATTAKPSTTKAPVTLDENGVPARR